MFLEFNRYILLHPDFAEKLPVGAEVILLDSRDETYNRFMLQNTPADSENVVFIDVGEPAPVRSRLRRPKLVARPRLPA